MNAKVKNISIIIGALSLLIIAIAVFNNYLSDKEVNSSNKELNDIVIKEYNEAKAKKDKNTLKFSPDYKPTHSGWSESEASPYTYRDTLNYARHLKIAFHKIAEGEVEMPPIEELNKILY